MPWMIYGANGYTGQLIAEVALQSGHAEDVHRGAAARRPRSPRGKLVRVPPAHEVREIPFADKRRTAMSVPWGDVATAWRSTGSPTSRSSSPPGRGRSGQRA